MLNGEQWQDHRLILLPFTVYCFPNALLLCAMDNGPLTTDTLDSHEAATKVLQESEKFLD
jgi:hypothetical protein